ncbi:MAG: response regulator transcription factor [Deltaproteobacteria bacterium]|nr:response regulator transcription factor [Deltaproteobacteria bacterium]
MSYVWLFSLRILGENLAGASGLKKKELSYVPILFITASEVDQNEVIEGLETGGKDYFRRPFDAGEPLSRINATIHLETVYDELVRVKAKLSRYISLSTLKKVEKMTSGRAQPLVRIEERGKHILKGFHSHTKTYQLL